MDAEVADADRSSSGPHVASVSRWLAAGARWLVRVGTMPGGDAIAWPAGLCYAGWLAGVLVSLAATLYPAMLAARVRPAAGMRH